MTERKRDRDRQRRRKEANNLLVLEENPNFYALELESPKAKEKIVRGLK